MVVDKFKRSLNYNSRIDARAFSFNINQNELEKKWLKKK